MRDCNGAFSFEGIELFSTSFEVALSSKHLRYCKLCSELNCSLMPKQTAMAEKTPPIVAHWTFYVIRNYLYRQGKSYCSIDVAGKHMRRHCGCSPKAPSSHPRSPLKKGGFHPSLPIIPIVVENYTDQSSFTVYFEYFICCLDHCNSIHKILRTK